MIKSIEKYLIGYIVAFWTDVVNQSQSQVNDLDQLHLSEIPSEAFERLQGLMPGISEIDRKEVRQVLSRSGPFSRLSGRHRKALKRSIRAKGCMIPSMTLFAAHMRVLEGASVCMKGLLGIKTGKRGRGCARPLESVLKGLYTVERNAHDEYRIQTLEGWRTIYAPFEERQELSCRQLWLFVMRHDDPAVIEQSHLAHAAKELGFHSPRIDALAAQCMLPSQGTSMGLENPLWTDDVLVPVGERKGQKAEKWLKKSKRARGYLYFDFAENVGTSAAQRRLKLEKFTPLIELACIYRVLFAHPFSPSPYAEIPSLSENATSQAQAVLHPSNESLPPHEATYNSGDSSEYESAADGMMEPETVLETENRFSPPPEESSDSGESSGYESAFDDLMLVPQDDDRLMTSSEGQSLLETENHLDSIGVFGAGEMEDHESRHVERDASDQSSSTLPSPGPMTTSMEARGNALDVRCPTKQNAESIVSNLPNLVEPNIRISGSAETIASSLNNDGSAEPRVKKSYHFETSLIGPTRSSYRTERVSDALEWLDLTCLQYPSRSVTGPQGPANWLSGQGTDLKALQEVDRREDTADTTGVSPVELLTLPAGHRERVSVDSPLTPPQLFEDMGTSNCPAGNGVSLVEMELLQQDDSEGRGLCGHVESAPNQLAEVEQIQPSSPQTKGWMASGVELEAAQPGLQKEPVTRTYSHPFDNGHPDNHRNDPQASSLGDTRHYEDCENIFIASDLSSEGSELNDGVLSNAGSAPRRDAAQGNTFAESNPSSPVSEDRAASQLGTDLLQTNKKGKSYFIFTSFTTDSLRCYSPVS